MFDTSRVLRNVATGSVVALLLALQAPLSTSGLRAQERPAHQMAHDTEVPTTGQRGDLASGIEDVSGKFTALAGALRDHWDWRPAEGVRSVGEVFGHVAAANMMFPTFAGIDAPEDFRGADSQATMGNLMALEGMGYDELTPHLEHSFTHSRHALGQIPDDRLGEPVSFFGMEGTVGSLMTMMATHMHEHLGQLIAYARMNGVAPPWSEGGE